MASPKTKTTAPGPDLTGQAQVPNHRMRLNLVAGAQAGFFRLRKREGCHYKTLVSAPAIAMEALASFWPHGRKS
jgi:hypothetical protein